MKTLSIIRHAKADLPDKYAQDIDRPLTARGHKDAATIAELLGTLEPSVDWIVSSPAARAHETANHIAKVLKYKADLFLVEAVYGAEPDDLLNVVGKFPVESEHTVLIGHNPGLCELLSGLCAGSPTRLNAHLAPGALAFVQLEIVRWDQVRWGCGQLQLLTAPKPTRKK